MLKLSINTRFVIRNLNNMVTHRLLKKDLKEMWEKFEKNSLNKWKYCELMQDLWLQKENHKLASE